MPTMSDLFECTVLLVLGERNIECLRLRERQSPALQETHGVSNGIAINEADSGLTSLNASEYPISNGVSVPRVCEVSASIKPYLPVVEINEYDAIRIGRTNGRPATAPIGENPQPALLRRLYQRGLLEQPCRRLDAGYQRRPTATTHGLDPSLVPPARHGRPQAHTRPIAAEANQRDLGACDTRLIEQRDKNALGKREPLPGHHRSRAIQQKAMQHAALCFLAHKAEMIGSQTLIAFRGKCAWPVDTSRSRAIERRIARALPPPKTAAHCTRGCALPMA